MTNEDVVTEPEEWSIINTAVDMYISQEIEIHSGVTLLEIRIQNISTRPIFLDWNISISERSKSIERH